jgi:hypothetical protein
MTTSSAPTWPMMASLITSAADPSEAVVQVAKEALNGHINHLPSLLAAQKRVIFHI